jgi:hypothetical protein
VDGAGSGLELRWVHALATAHRGLAFTSGPAAGRYSAELRWEP